MGLTNCGCAGTLTEFNQICPKSLTRSVRWHTLRTKRDDPMLEMTIIQAPNQTSITTQYQRQTMDIIHAGVLQDNTASGSTDEFDWQTPELPRRRAFLTVARLNSRRRLPLFKIKTFLLSIMGFSEVCVTTGRTLMCVIAQTLCKAEISLCTDMLWIEVLRRGVGNAD